MKLTLSIPPYTPAEYELLYVTPLPFVDCVVPGS